MEHQIKYGTAYALVTLSLDSGESVTNAPGELALAPTLPGDIVHRVLGAETIYLTWGRPSFRARGSSC